MGIGTNLKLALKEHDLTVAELSRKTGISTNTFYAMIRRDNNKISPEMLKKICDNTDITVYDLLDDYDALAAKYYGPKDSDNSIYIDPNLQKLYETAIEEELNKLLEQRKEQRERNLLADYRKLNKIGQSEAQKRVSELTEIPRYTKPDEPPKD